MTVGDILDGAFKLLKANVTDVLVITIVFLAPFQLIAAYVQRDTLELFGLLFDPSALDVADPDQLTPNPLPGLVAGLVSLLVLPYVTGAITRVVGDSYLGRPTGIGTALRAAGRRWWALLAAWFLVHLLELGVVLVAFGVLLLGIATQSGALIVLGTLGVLIGFVVAVAVMPFFVAVAPAVVMEDIGAIAAMRRSARLLRPRYWGVLGIAVLSGFLANLLASILSFVPTIVSFALGEAGWVLFAVGNVVGNAVALPIVAIVATLLYFDGRIRREGFDLQVMADELARSLGKAGGHAAPPRSSAW